MSNLDYLGPHEIMFSFYRVDDEGHILLTGHLEHMEKLWKKMCGDSELMDGLKVERRDMN